ncbi:hypothetical protein L1277_002055 [Okibacterium sp. HSC-33S16]|uniref:DUF5671 domain-containing protein n=1 Tax=Okibacterium sp. HSC-33S16 TaxID=2910965 RepID=UPI00209EBCCE|nr:DUF5671 domain-containing protein [Okibacterium sp. HSC-33S16]MCP2031957.1 hypothetical protein [Okibacterium sp. HSC-33S16]
MTGVSPSPVSSVVATGRPSPAGQVVRRLVVYTLLAVLVDIAAIGLAGLLGRALDIDTVLAGNNTSGLAQSLAFTLIAGPLAALLWWSVWRRLADPAERASLAWGIYLSTVLTVSLIVFSVALFGVLAGLIDGDWDGSGAATALVWAAVWAWHERMRRHPSKGPVRLATVPAVLGASYGLVLGASAAAGTLSIVFSAALSRLGDGTLIEGAWGTGALHSLVWALGGSAIWALHWYGARARTTASALGSVALVVLGILAASIATLGGIGTMLFVALRLAVDRTDRLPVLLDPLAPALAAAAVGAAVWLYARAVTQTRSPATRNARALATSGVALAGAASGIGVIVNSALGILALPLAGDNTRTLLLGGLSALLVGAPVWWFAWRPHLRTDATWQLPGRRIYLIAIFGISAVVALITLLVIGYRVFEFALGESGGLLDRVRAPLGLLTATALVAGYHFSVWRQDRASAEGSEADASTPPERPREIGEVILVTSAEPVFLVGAISAATGAPVTVWRTQSEIQAPAEGGTEPGTGSGVMVSVESVLAALDGVTAQRVLVVATDRLEVLPLLD